LISNNFIKMRFILYLLFITLLANAEKLSAQHDDLFIPITLTIDDIEISGSTTVYVAKVYPIYPITSRYAHIFNKTEYILNPTIKLSYPYYKNMIGTRTTVDCYYLLCSDDVLKNVCSEVNFRGLSLPNGWSQNIVFDKSEYSTDQFKELERDDDGNCINTWCEVVAYLERAMLAMVFIIFIGIFVLMAVLGLSF